MPIKVTMKIQLSTGQTVDGVFIPRRTAGWTETVYLEGSDMNGARLKVLPGVGGPKDMSLVALRARLLPRSGVVKSVLFTVLDPPGPSIPVVTNTPGASDLATDQPTLSLLLRATTGEGNRANIYLRGLPDARAVGGEYSGTVKYDNDLEAYGNCLKQFQLRVRRRLPLVKIDKVVPDTTDGVVTYFGATPITVGMTARVLRTLDACRRKRGGAFRVKAANAAAGTLTLADWPWGNTNGGSVRQELIGYSTIADVGLVKVVTRRVGRPFDLSAGRRSARR